MTTCRCGLAVRFCPDLNAYGHVDRLPRGRGHYVRLSTAAPVLQGVADPAVGGSRERFPERGVGRSAAAEGR